MTTPLHIALGSNGDIIIILPYLKAESERIGAPIPLLVAKAYMPLLEGVSYVNPIEFAGEWHDLTAALSWLRREMPECPVKLLQFYRSRMEPALPSFCDESWWLANAWKDWDRQPLCFDRRDLAREAELRENVFLLNDSRPIILVGTKGRSSPFQHSKRLLARIRKEFGKSHQIVNLDKVRAHRVYDLLGLYDRAAALVSIDTVHLHLSRASTVPVFALARDYPLRWHGTPHQERFAFHCRYSDYLKREDEFMVALRETLEGTASKIPMGRASPKGHYNPAIMPRPEFGGLRIVTRHHFAGDWRTRLRMGGMDQDIQLPKKWSKHSHEDLRFFEHGGETWASITLSTAKNKRMPRCVTAYGKFPADGTMPKLCIPDFGHNDFSGMEKNWVFFSHDGKVHAIYSCDPEHVVIELDGDEAVKPYVTPGPKWAYGEIRGGTPPVPYSWEVKTSNGHLMEVKWGWLRFFHSRIWEWKRNKPRTKLERIFEAKDRIPWRYYVGALVMESEPPFRVLQVSKSPILTGTEQWVPACPHWKPNVIIPYGCVPCDDGWTVSLGVNDALSVLATIKPEQLKLV